jgi:hypothetical protein
MRSDGEDHGRLVLERERKTDAILPTPRRICVLSVHTCPIAAPGGKETGGMNVYVRELSRQLGRRGYLVDNFTRSESASVPHILDTDLGPNVRVIHVVAGPEEHVTKADAWRYVEEFEANVLAFMASEGLSYDLYHSHYWISGRVACRLAVRKPAPIIHMFHTLGVMRTSRQAMAMSPSWRTGDRSSRRWRSSPTRSLPAVISIGNMSSGTMGPLRRRCTSSRPASISSSSGPFRRRKPLAGWVGTHGIG